MLKLNSGKDIPQKGFGTWMIPTEKAKDVVYNAIKNGYRHIDCAACYLNEREVGEGIKKALDEGIVKREDIFITSKIYMTYFDRVEEACKQSLKDLKLDYLDLYITHWPVSFAPLENLDMRKHPDLHEMDYKSMTPKFGKVPLHKVWEDMEKLVEKKLVRSIGVSNYTTPLIIDMMNYAKIKPAVNQIEINPFFQRNDLLKIMDRFGIKAEAYSPLFRADKKLLENEVMKKIAETHKKSVPQVVLKWLHQNGRIIIAKTTNEKRMKENQDIDDFKLSKEEIEKINGLDVNKGVLEDMARGAWGFWIL